MEEQARLSGLELACGEWTTEDWPPFPAPLPEEYSSIVVDHGDTQSLLILGGCNGGGRRSSVIFTSVMVLDIANKNIERTDKRWRMAPSMNVGRKQCTTVACNNGLYVIGGLVHTNRRRPPEVTTSIERVALESVLTRTVTIHHRWTRLECSLSSPREGCAAAAVHNRYIVVLGGTTDSFWMPSSSVEILDTAIHAIIAGIDMTTPRFEFGVALIGTRLVAVGGKSKDMDQVNSVEYIELNDKSSCRGATTLFQKSSLWTIHADLHLAAPRSRHAVSQLASCLIVAGGSSDSVEVIDVNRCVVWSLPSTRIAGYVCSIFVMPSRIVLLSFLERNGTGLVLTHESLPLMTQKEHIKRMYSCRAELDIEIRKLRAAIQNAISDSSNIAAVREGAQAEALLPILESLCDDDEFPTLQDLYKKVKLLAEGLEKAQSLTERLPIAEEMQRWKEKIAQNEAVTESRNAAVESVDADTNAHTPSVVDVFYRKLVEVNEDNVMAHLYMLENLVSDVHQFRIFYTFLKHVFRLGLVPLGDFRQYAFKALKRTSETTAVGGEAAVILEHTTQKCREDGVLDEQQSLKQPKDRSLAIAGCPSFETDIRHHLAGYEFRVGQVILQRNGLSSQKADTPHKQLHHYYLSRVKLLGWSLSQMHSAFGSQRRYEGAVAAICSILNAIVFDYADVVRQPMQTAAIATELAFLQIVDFGDVAHIVSVVERCGNLSLQHACNDGIAMVDRATAEAPNDELDEAEGRGAGKEILVAAMAQLANAATKRTKNADEVVANSKDVATILALTVTARLVEASEINQGNTDNTVTDEQVENCSLSSPPEETVALEPSGIALRLQRMEAMMGVLYRMSSLESYCGLNNEGMSIPERVARLETQFE